MTEFEVRVVGPHGERPTETRYVNIDNVEQVKPSSIDGWGSVLCFNSGETATVRKTPEEIYND